MVQQKPGWFPSPFCLNGLFVRDRRPCVAFVLLSNQPRSDDTNRFIVFDRRLHRTAFGDLLTTVVFLQGSGDVPGSEVCLTGFVLKSLRSVVP